MEHKETITDLLSGDRRFYVQVKHTYGLDPVWLEFERGSNWSVTDTSNGVWMVLRKLHPDNGISMYRPFAGIGLDFVLPYSNILQISETASEK